MGIEPTMPLLAQSIIGFEDRGRHQSGTRFQDGSYTESGGAPTARGCPRRVVRLALHRPSGQAPHPDVAGDRSDPTACPARVHSRAWVTGRSA